MIYPTIHLNGTGKDTLLEQYRAASDALRDAIEAINETGPNGRDYYPQGGGATEEAIKQHTSRRERLIAVLAELDDLARYVYES